MRRIFGIVLAVLLADAPAAQATDIHLMAAASLKEVVTELADTYARKNPRTTFTKNFGGSGMLAKQLENGAPADIFISANQEWIDYLKGKKLVQERSVATIAYNALVFAGKPETKAFSMKDVPKLRRVAIGSPKSVPAGEYAMEAMKKAGIEKEVSEKLVMAKDVRECLMYAERGEVDGAFVYRTDALQAKKVKILFEVPQGLSPRVAYPAAVTTSAGKREDVAAFYRYLQSGDAKKVLLKHGFGVK